MKNYIVVCAILGVALGLWGSGVIPAIVPAAVPSVNKIGNSSKFQLGSSGAVSGDCAQFDSNLNVTGPGTGSGCGVSGTAGGGLTVYSGTAGLALSGTLFFPVGGGSQASTTETSVDADISASTTISRFGVNISTALGIGNSVVFTWRKNAADQAVTCTISGASATSCADTVNSFSVLPGDLIAIKAVFSGTIAVAPIFVLTAQVGSLASGQVGTGTQYQIAQYPANGIIVTGVTVPGCLDTGGNHLNFNSSNGVFSCGTSTSIPPSYLQLTDPTAISFTWHNQGSASVTNRTRSIFLFAPGAGGDNFRGREIAEPTPPVSITMGLVPQITAQASNQCGLYVTDGTRLVIETLSTGGNNNGMAVQTWSAFTGGFNGNYVTPGINLNSSPIFLKVLDDGVNLTFYVSVNGQDFTTLTTQSRTNWLSSPSAIGYECSSSNGTWPAAVLLVSWLQGTS